MALVLPNPGVPQNGQPLDATPLLANQTAITQAIQSFDASQVQAGTLVAAAFNASINPNTLLKETTRPFVSIGLVWSTISGLNGGMTSGVMYYNGIRVSVNSVSSNTFTASKDTYIDIDVNGNITYQAVTNGAAAPALTASSIRVAKVVTSGSAITSIVITGYDSLLNPIYPKGDISAANLLYGTVFRRQGGDANVWQTTGTTTYDTSNANPLVQTGSIAAPAGQTTITFPVAYISAPIVLGTMQSSAGAYPSWYLVSFTNTSFAVQMTGGQVGASFLNWIAIGI